MSFTFQPVRVATGSDEEGLLVFDDDQRLLAALTHHSDQYDSLSGHWIIEVGFGLPGGLDHPAYADLEAAQEGIRQRLARGR
ncbi:hypothetical protein DC522_12625 [Microvirga sp. KLBC 81]|uniref:hypothetical protein n=1 Tax=Microvirga sp. KLBC 81 TaxID=1862707 RepID=UPI000D5202EA|nr:hypothetical protein [Microvirga sp. KLBC 81]PVE24128.1 hypothetical protein DC522_12625 [Microvirga sp. KLBC 81]